MGDLAKTTTVLQRFDDALIPLPGVGFRQLGDPGDELRSHRLWVDFDVWDDMGQPSTITVTIEPGDRLNEASGEPAGG